MRKVLVSPGFGAGWSSWNTEHGKALAEDECLIALVEAGRHEGRIKDDRGPEYDYHECSQEFHDRALEVARANGAKDDWHPYYGGVTDLVVREVSGRYRINEYDGSESLVEESEEVWW